MFLNRFGILQNLAIKFIFFIYFQDLLDDITLNKEIKKKNLFFLSIKIVLKRSSLLVNFDNLNVSAHDMSINFCLSVDIPIVFNKKSIL